MLFAGDISWGMGVTTHVLKDSSTPTFRNVLLVKISSSQSKDKKKTKDMLVGGVLVGRGWSSSTGTGGKRGWLGKCGGNALYTYT